MAARTLKNTITLFAVLCTNVAVVAQTGSAAASARNAGSNKSDLQTALEQREKQGWEAFKNKDKTAFAAIVTDDYTAVIADGSGERDLTGTLDAMKEITINSYTLSDFKLTWIGSNAALLHYRASANYTIGNQTISGKLAVGDIWVKRGGQWKSLRYHETEMK